jgi:Ca2+-binding EF-hand superfamily protein
MKFTEQYFRGRRVDGERKRDIADIYTAVTGYRHKRGLRAYKLDKIYDSNNHGNIDKSELLKIVVSQNQQMQISSNSVKNDNRK